MAALVCDGHDPESIPLFQINDAIRKPADRMAAGAGLARQSERRMPPGEEQGEINCIEKPIAEQRSRGFVRCRGLNEFFSGEAMIDDALHAIGSGPRP